jgi:hypothetical protein
VKRLGVSRSESLCLAGVVLLGALLRLVNLPLRGGWDSDQGTEMLGLRAALESGRLPTFGPAAISVQTPFHHGALYYDLLLPAAWLGNGDPTWVVGEIALLSLIVIPIVWWVARSIGGPAAGLTAALLAATSAALVSFATFIWNPTLVEPGAALALLGAWQAVRSSRPQWWVVAALGAAVAVQAHIAAAVILLPLALTFLVDIRRARARRRVLAWGAAGVALFTLTYLPLIGSELGSGFADTRSMLAYFFTDSNSAASLAPPVRLFVAMIRVAAWPLTRWPIVDLKPAFGLALAAASALILGLVWRVGETSERMVAIKAAARHAAEIRNGADAGDGAGDAGGAGGSAVTGGAGGSDAEAPASIERFGTRLIAGWLLLIILALGLGLHAVSEFQALPTEQYHVVADPVVLVAAGLIVGAMWRPLAWRSMTMVRRAAVVALVVATLSWNFGHMPPATSRDGGWPGAQIAVTRLEREAGGAPMALVSLWRADLGPNKGTDAYLYPLTRDGVETVPPDRARIVVLLCDEFWLGWLGGCSGTAQTTWLNTDPAGAGLTRVDQFTVAPDRIFTVYRRGP